MQTDILAVCQRDHPAFVVHPVKGLTVTIRVPELTRKGVSLTSGAAVKAAVEDGRLVVKRDLDAADALVLR